MALQNNPTEAFTLPGLEARAREVTAEVAKFDITLVLYEQADGTVAGALRYAQALFDATTVRRWMGHWRHLLEGVVAAPDRPWSELSILAAAERHQLLWEWSGDGGRRGEV